MSYCVNCGVELDKTCGICPLCQTPVNNPASPVDTLSPKPFPSARGKTEPVTHHEFTILASTVLFTTALVCFLLNYFVFVQTSWSVYVIGFCAILWLMLLPLFFPDKLSVLMCLFINGISIAAYLAVISKLHPGQGWYLDIGLPVTILATCLVIIYALFTARKKRSYISRSALILGILAVLCVSLELMIDSHFSKPLALSWSAVVLACCASIDVMLITLYFLKGLREEIRRRMHF